jgi:hypothetical protein
MYSSRLEKNREGYFTNTNILNHTTAAMDILDKDYSDEDHVLIFDNASTHLKREEDASSATKMPKNTKEWGITMNKLDEDCNTVHGPDGKVLKMCVQMDNAKFFKWGPTITLLSSGSPSHRGIQGHGRDFD